jgi:two-component system, sensor histidine kinase and response regulator
MVITSAHSVVRHGVVPIADPPRRVFVIDDDDVMLLSCRRILEKDGYAVETFDTGVDGLRRLADVRPQLLLVDLKMPELDGLQVIDRVRAIDTEIVIAVITGYATISTAVDAMKAGAYDFLPKPFTPDELRLIVNRGYERWQLAMESSRLREEKAEAERRFVTFVSHQLKSPVVAAKQYLDVLLFEKSDAMPARERDWLLRAQVRLDEMLTLIHDWLELARVSSGTVCEPGETCDLRDVIGHVVATLEPQSRAADVAIETRLTDDLPRAVGDGVGLTTVITNLVSNGVKYNRPGGRVSISTRHDDAYIELEVADTGIGIADDAMPRLFEEFYRVRNDDTQDIPGTGLGLAICRRIVTTLGGSIEVSSRPGEGTTFVVRLPRAAAEPPGGPRP